MRIMTVFFASATIALGSALAASAADVEAGKALYSGCMGCHGSMGNGGVGPKVGGRSAEQLAGLLKKYRAGETVGPRSAMMAPIAAQLTDADIENITAYMSSLK